MADGDSLWPSRAGWTRIVATGDVIVVTGPPGAGKSTVAEQLASLLDPSALVTGDDFCGFLRSGAIRPWTCAWSVSATDRATAHTDLDAATQLWHDFHRAHIDRRQVLNGREKHPAETAGTLVERLDDATIRYP